jgi:hypothetical protein
MATWRMKGQYLKNCNCIAFCPCDSDGDPAPHGFCEGVIGQHVQEGNFEGTDLGGLTWLVAFHFPGPLYEGNGTVEPYVDERANQQQRDALLQIFSGQAGGTWFEVVAALAPNVKEPHFVPISWEFDKAKRQSRVEVPGLIEMTNAPILIRPTGDENHVTVTIPNGIEYKEMEVAHATMKSSGALQFEWHKTSGGLADIEHTSSGLVA